MEIYGIGNDIVEISRIKEAVEKNSRFKEKVYSVREIEYLESKPGYASHAGRFAAKEAVSKALGTGVRGFGLKDIEIVNDELGKPYVNLLGELAEKNRNLHIYITISHSRDYATATALAVIK